MIADSVRPVDRKALEVNQGIIFSKLGIPGFSKKAPKGLSPE
jgi:hypothetical protein